MNKEYKIKLDLNKKLYNKKMAFNQFDKNVNDFYIEVTKNNEVVKDLDKSIITLVAIKPNNAVDAQFIEVKEGQIYADLKPSMCDLVGNYQAKAMIVLEGEIVTTDTINYSVSEDKIISRLNDDVVSDERFPLFTDALARLSTIEISEEQRVINEAERILSEENRKIEESKRVEAELVRQHEEADRTKYDATRESNENIRKINEEARISSENVRLENEANRIEQETNRVKAEQLRKDNYNFMTEDEERRRLEANAHKEAEVLRVQAETNRVNEEAKRRTTEQARVLAENTRVSNENTRKANEETRQNNETHRVEAETQRQSRYNSFIADAEANANNFENYTNNAKVKEEERKSNELDRKSQEARRVSNEVERISNENTRKANEKAREKNETSRQNIFENKADEVDKKIIELNTIKDNFVSSINTKVDTKISELDNTKSDMTNTVTNKIDEVENRFNALTSKQQQDAEVIDARDGETSLKARLDRDIEKAKQVYVNVKGSHISTDSSVGYLKDVEILGNTIQSASNLADIRSVGDTVEGQELYEIPVLSCGKNLIPSNLIAKGWINSDGVLSNGDSTVIKFVKVKQLTNYSFSNNGKWFNIPTIFYYDKDKKLISKDTYTWKLSTPSNCCYVQLYLGDGIDNNVQLEEGTQVTPYEPYQEDKLTILSPVQLEKVGDVADRIIEKDGVWGVEKHIKTDLLKGGSDEGFGLNKALPKGGYQFTWFANMGATANKNSEVISSTMNSYVVSNEEYSSNIWIYDGVAYVIHHPTISTADEIKLWLQANPTIVKFALNTPQFIPLPHNQQIKLRTFAGKTNISFLTEIEGTIKAQVPKSLGATVNTHTEQISNLNKELDRVKKLEESTVSTVETESDFTTVEATSNGYFEDVKLEGKTLVNLGGNTNLWGVNSSGKSDVDYNIISANDRSICMNKLTDSVDYIYFGKKIDANLFKANTEYTIVCNVNNVTKFGIMSGNTREKIIDYVTISNGYNCFKATSTDLSTVAGVQNMLIYGLVERSLIADNCSISDVIILEGDHTQNPPSYFEGLKSVGDVVDEIVVSSVKGDGNLFDKKNIHLNKFLQANGDETSVEGWFVSDYIKVADTCYIKGLINIASSNLARICVYNQNKTFKTLLSQPLNTTLNISSFIENGDYIRITEKIEQVDSIVVCKNEISNQIYQSDKKRLLYYNEETQAWEKPILREGDSIEKHADGKYYYHQRSAEVVLNGSENWNNDKNSSTMSPETYRQSIQFDAIDIPSASFNTKTSPNIISDLLPTVIFGDVYSHNHIGISISGTGSVGTHIIINNNFIDVTELKQWLQANNLTVVYQLAQEKVYECTNIDLITYANETNFIVESGVLSPKTTLKVHSNISNVVSLLQKKVSLLESNMTKYMITQNRLMLASRYNADTVSFKVDVASFSDTFEYDNDLYELILNNILVGKDNYNREYIENLIRFYWMDFIISDEMYSTLFEIIKEQHNPKIEEEEETPLI